MPNKKKRVVKKALKKARKNTTVDPIMKKVAGKTQDPVRSGSAGSGKITKTTKAAKLRGLQSKVTSTRVKKKIQTVNKAAKKGIDQELGPGIGMTGIPCSKAVLIK